MHDLHLLPFAAAVFLTLVPGVPAQTKQAALPPLPDIRQLMKEVQEHQRQSDKVRENYTYTSLNTIQDIDANGQVKRTEVDEFEEFFVNGHQIGRMVKKDGKPLEGQELEKETERVTKRVEKAQKTSPDQALEGQEITLGRVLEVMDVRNPRRENYRGRPTIVFDFMGRKDAKTHGMAEDVSKKLQGTVWIDEADRVVAHLDVSFDDNFHVAGGLVANVEKGSNVHFDQAPVNGEIWFPTGGEGTFNVRFFLVKGFRKHGIERDYDFKRFKVDAEPGKDAKAIVETKQ
ncbi:MAG: hypothetical protein ABR905_13155 [Terracidiphilus sp.]|jgi:hypothetical protein